MDTISVQLQVRDRSITLRLPPSSEAEVRRACEEVNRAIQDTGGGQRLEFGRAMIIASLRLAQRALEAEARMEGALEEERERHRALAGRLQALLDDEGPLPEAAAGGAAEEAVEAGDAAATPQPEEAKEPTQPEPQSQEEPPPPEEPEEIDYSPQSAAEAAQLPQPMPEPPEPIAEEPGPEELQPPPELELNQTPEPPPELDQAPDPPDQMPDRLDFGRPPPDQPTEPPSPDDPPSGGQKPLL